MLTPRTLAAISAGVVALLISGHPILAFLTVAVTGLVIVARLRPAPDQPDTPGRPAVDLDRAIATIERLARLGAGRRRTRSRRR